jgi:hypothetical protein
LISCPPKIYMSHENRIAVNAAPLQPISLDSVEELCHVEDKANAKVAALLLVGGAGLSSEGQSDIGGGVDGNDPPTKDCEPAFTRMPRPARKAARDEKEGRTLLWWLPFAGHSQQSTITVLCP